LQEEVYSVRSIGPIGRETTGTAAVVLKAAWMFLVGLVCCAAASAAEPERLRAADLPQFRLETLRPAAGSASVDVDGFRPAHLSIDRSERASVRFYDTHLMPELRDRFEGMSRVYQNMPWIGNDLEQFTMRADVTDSARRGLEHATTRALREFVLEWSRIEERLLSIPLSKKVSSSLAGVSPGPRVRSDQDLDFSFGISSMMPQVGLRYRLRKTVTRFEVDGHGSVDLEFSRLANVYTRVAVQYDAEETGYGLYYRARF
jgi:hypothetical protein